MEGLTGEQRLAFQEAFSLFDKNGSSLFLCFLLLGCGLAAIGFGSNATALLVGSLVCV
jgi:hypothetical protein